MTTNLKDRAGIDSRDDDLCWQAMLSNDTSLDGVFVVCVKSTGIYCRPSCSARRPKRENVTFLPGCDAAEAAGFRACKRCYPRLDSPAATAELVRRACVELEEAGDEPPKLAAVSRRLGVSAAYLQRTFRSALGVTPRQYAEARRLERLKGGLRDGHSVTRALYDAGYSSSSRLYESAGDNLGMTPATYRKGGRGMTVRYHVADSPLGRLLVAGTERGVCAVQLADSDAGLGVSLRGEFPHAVIEPDDGSLAAWVGQILEYLGGVRPRLDLPLDIQGTAFQVRVWRALKEIAYGTTRTYSEIARAIGRPRAARAVGQACGRNPAPLVIPCHRVVGSNGSLGGYALGVERKRALLEKERANA